MNHDFRYLLTIILICKSLNLLASPDFKIEIDGKKTNFNEKVSLFSGYHEFVFYFPQQIKTGTSYNYKITEIEKNWIITPFPIARYTNLNGGNYHFQVKFINSNNQLVTVSKSLEIKENFWEKWWFYLLVGISAMAGVSILIYFWFLYDLRQKMRTQAIRQKIAADLHDEVGANLSSISFLVESLKKSLNRQKEKFDPILDRISGNSLETAGLINDTIWALNPDYDNFEKLLERIKSFGSSILSAKDIAFEIENNLSKNSIELIIEQRRNLYLIMKEAINNIAKHSMATKAKLVITNTENGLNIKISDNGVGIDLSGITEGNGLKNYDLRSDANNIKVQVSSDKGKGTLIEIRAKI
jgi:signal transduction histidine kinase